MQDGATEEFSILPEVRKLVLEVQVASQVSVEMGREQHLHWHHSELGQSAQEDEDSDASVSEKVQDVWAVRYHSSTSER